MIAFHNDSVRDWFASYGIYISLWSSTESLLTQFIEFIVRFHDESAIASKQPKNLAPQIAFIKNAAEKVPSLESERAELLAIANALTEESRPWTHNGAV